MARERGRKTLCCQELSSSRHLRGRRRSHPKDSYRLCVAMFVMMGLGGLHEGIVVIVAVATACRLLEGHFELDWGLLGHDDDCNCFVVGGLLDCGGRMVRGVVAVSVLGDVVLRTFRELCPRELPSSDAMQSSPPSVSLLSPVVAFRKSLYPAKG